MKSADTIFLADAILNPSKIQRFYTSRKPWLRPWPSDTHRCRKWNHTLNPIPGFNVAARLNSYPGGERVSEKLFFLSWLVDQVLLLHWWYLFGIPRGAQHFEATSYFRHPNSIHPFTRLCNAISTLSVFPKRELCLPFLLSIWLVVGFSYIRQDRAREGVRKW